MSEVLEAVAVKNEVLKKKLKRLLEEHQIRDKLERGWFKFDESRGTGLLSNGPIIVSAVDGGNNKKSLLSFDVYVIKAKAEGFLLKADGSMQRAFSSRIVDVDVLIPTENSGDRLTLYRQVAEIKMLYLSTKRSTLVLGDGSLESLITRPIHLKLKILDEEKSLDMTCEYLETVIAEGLGEISYESMTVKKTVEEIVMSGSQNDEEAKRRALTLELLEKGAALRLLLKEVLDRGSVLVFITKTGRSRAFFNTPVSDQYVLSVTTRGAGFYLDEDKSFDKPVDLLNKIPYECGLHRLVRDMSYVRGLARLRDGGPVLGIEVVYNEKNVPFSRREAFVKTFETLNVISPGGYPHPLFIADREAHIENTDVDKVLSALGLSPSISGREALEYD